MNRIHETLSPNSDVRAGPRAPARSRSVLPEVDQRQTQPHPVSVLDVTPPN